VRGITENDVTIFGSAHANPVDRTASELRTKSVPSFLAPINTLEALRAA